VFLSKPRCGEAAGGAWFGLQTEEDERMNVITSRLPSHLAGRRLPGRFARIGVLNLILGAAFIGAGIAAYLTVGTGSSTSNAAVRTATVQRGVVLSTLSATGTLQAATQLSLDFTSSGQIVSVNVKAGQHVKKGQVLGRIDSTSAHQALLQAEASLRSANANLQTTLTGETAPQRAQDAVTVAQARQSIANAKISFAATKRSIALDKVTTAASLSQAQKQLRADQGQLQVDLAKQKTDSAIYANVDAATAAVTADKSKVANDQAKQQTDQQSQLVWQQQLSSDQASLKTAQTNNDAAGITAYTNATNSDQGQLNALAKILQSDGFATTTDQSQLSTDQAAQSALTSDAAAIKADEQKLAQDHTSIASGQTSRSATQLKDVQSLQSAKQQIASAQLGLKSTLASIAMKQAPPTPSALAGAQGSVLQAQISLTNAQKAYTETTLRAPGAGVVAAVNGTVGTQATGGGSSSNSSASSSSSGTGSSSSSSSSSGFVTLTGLQGMQVLAPFAETDAVKIQPGQAATVTVDALPSKQLAAHLLSVSDIASSSSSVVTYNGVFALDRSESELKPGMTANVDVVTGEVDNVLHVPTAAVRGSGASATVTVLQNGKQTSVPVVAGLQGDSSTAILSGLKENETVVLPSVSISASTTGGTSGTTTTGITGRGGGGGAFFGGGGFGG
jgi:multidrug efflux pump subunit AcrA (membrane-fusion protein)